jgi:mannan endo-1,4-beta-mannosidase
MKALRIAIPAVLAVVACAAVAVIYLAKHEHPPGPKLPTASTVLAPKTCDTPDTHNHYVGVVVYRPWQVTLPMFERLSGIQPKIVEYDVNFGEPLDMDRIALIYHAAFPIIQLDPYRATLSEIAKGKFDAYLRHQAEAVAKIKCPIAISFGHEMNGNWYPWGASHVKPAAYVAAWRHIWEVFEHAGAHNVIWIWAITRVSPYVSSIQQWWPGQKYVNWVGIDGYYLKPSNTFTYIFYKTLQQVHSLTNDPVLITQTSVAPQDRQGANIKNLFQGARKAGVFAVIWFNIEAKQRWNLAGRPASVIADFKEAAKAFER